MMVFDSDGLDPIDSPQALASAWFAHLRSGNATEADRRAIANWCAQSPDHQAAWEDVNDTWRALAAMRQDPAVARLRIQALEPTPQQFPRRFGSMPKALAAAIALMILGAGTYAFVRNGASQPTEIASTPQTKSYRDLRTGIGQRSTANLPDGSQIILSTATIVRAFDGQGERRFALLSGEAFFKVHKDPARPFIVDSTNVETQAVGTAFNVRVEEGTTIVTLAEGRLKITRMGQRTRAPKTMMMEAGSQLTLSSGADMAVRTVDTALVTGWTTGQLTFEDRPLREVVDEMNRYSTRKMTLRDTKLGSTRVNGVFASGNIPAFINALESLQIARSVRQNDGTILLSPL